jgi:O6-methylguanine-DNA--protein-cysteine methyltransferase
VGGACAANEIALVIPCHRVVGSQGSLGGFMSAKGRPERELFPLGGKARSAKGALIGAVDGDPISIKRWLLKHEGYRFGA